MKTKSNNEIIKEAQEMATSIAYGCNWRRWEYRIKGNPYKFHKKNSLVWYNAFYDKCREIGRSI